MAHEVLQEYEYLDRKQICNDRYDNLSIYGPKGNFIENLPGESGQQCVTLPYM